jgi:rSAM/selenodomain-associated transferase 2
MLSVIIPTLNAEHHLPELLAQLEGHVGGHVGEIIITDGGSTDKTLAIALAAKTRIAMGSKGRGWQLARGVQWGVQWGVKASEDWLLFLHADTQLGDDWLDAVQHHINYFPSRAGYFRFKLNADGFWPRWIELCVRLRCTFLALPYGDQGLLIRRDVFEAAGGYPDWPLFEDVQIVRSLGRRRLRALRVDVVTSPERYEKQGYMRRSFRNLGLLTRFFLGANPNDLSKRY